ncbi:Putative diflavin flavoprotein A 5 [Phycisphaerae bacterium RAS2]|nr:Putative diflavin flavoprotein A 5 [Phycisphaerae bacterium RAS2]
MALDSTGQEHVARALGRIPSGCSILTVAVGNRRTGVLVSWAQQAAFEPPMVSVGVKKGRPVEQLIDAAGQFVLNLLGENPSAMFKHFGRGFALEEDAFAGLAVEAVPGGVAIPDRVARLSVAVRQKVDAGDHWLYVGEIIDADGGADGAKPYVHLRKNGLSY